MAGESTVRDALVAEMLGDIGKLHDAVDSLKEVLPRETEAVEERITSLIGLLQKAGDAYRGQIEAYTNAQAGTVLAKIKEDGATAQGQIKADAAEAKLDLSRVIAGAIVEVGNTVKTTIQAAMASPVQEVVRTLQQSTWTNIGFCFLAGLIGGSVPVVVWALIH